MPIAHTTVAGATAATSQFKKNLITKSEGLADYRVSKQVTIYIKGPSNIIQTQL